ncbi:hypothetical protein LK08_04170 [Streptomyces sp. MUSC 125]|nr:hypothetical protein LK08_04170 [Streptomyces sp. MUSC 125]
MLFEGGFPGCPGLGCRSPCTGDRVDRRLQIGERGADERLDVREVRAGPGGVQGRHPIVVPVASEPHPADEKSR